MLRAEEELHQQKLSGNALDPDNYYELIRTITDDEVLARHKQAELMFLQMEDANGGSHAD